MAEISRDPILGVTVELEAGEKLVATFRPSAAVYWRTNGILAVTISVVAGVALQLGGNPFPWVGPLAAILAIGFRALFLKSEALAEEWKLTNRRLIGPGGRVALLSGLKDARPFFGAVQLITQRGDKHLMKYQGDAAATIAAINAARGLRK